MNKVNIKNQMTARNKRQLARKKTKRMLLNQKDLNEITRQDIEKLNLRERAEIVEAYRLEYPFIGINTAKGESYEDNT
jgi:hypothetical protein